MQFLHSEKRPKGLDRENSKSVIRTTGGMIERLAKARPGGEDPAAGSLYSGGRARLVHRSRKISVDFAVEHLPTGRRAGSHPLPPFAHQRWTIRPLPAGGRILRFGAEDRGAAIRLPRHRPLFGVAGATFKFFSSPTVFR